MRYVWLAMVFVSTGDLAAQARVMSPTPPLDSARAGVRDALLVLRDSLNSIDVAAARLQRDYRQASGPSLLSRARVMHRACASSARTVQPTKQIVLAANLSDPKRAKRRAELVSALDRLKETLSRCEKEFAAMSGPGQAETVRGYANDRAVRVQGALRRYEQTLREFFGAMGIRVMPLGANPPPVAG
jgi:hypothetical protein